MLLPLILFLSLALSTAAQTQVPAPQVETIYDDKADRTTVRLLPIKISGANGKYQSLEMAPSFSYAGKNPQRPEHVDFELRSVVRGRLDSDLYVLFVIEGEKIFLSSNRWAIKRPVAGRVWMGERLVFRMPYETFVKMANARSAEIWFDEIKFSLGDEQQRALRELLKGMDPPIPH